MCQKGGVTAHSSVVSDAPCDGRQDGATSRAPITVSDHTPWEGFWHMEEPAMRIGYARVSTADQPVALQREALEQRGCTKVFQEVASGAHGE